ncbi:TPA: hypothetical protein QH047_005129, partial [Escherichia coli]|nr:hypothetical protein [Escherichia coli]HDV8901605.1 hypothetical protein [Escherichia coli]
SEHKTLSVSWSHYHDDDVLKNLLNGWFMHIAIHAKNLKELADKKGQFIAIYRGFLLSLKDK